MLIESSLDHWMIYDIALCHISSNIKNIYIKKFVFYNAKINHSNH